jgi:hypothetical protein
VGLGGIDSEGNPTAGMDGSFFQPNADVKSDGMTYHVAFNVGLLSEAPNKGGFDGSNLLLLGMSKGNIGKYNTMSSNPIESYSPDKKSNFLRPTYKTKIRFSNGDKTTYRTTHTKLGIDNNSKGRGPRTFHFSLNKLPGRYNIVK